MVQISDQQRRQGDMSDLCLTSASVLVCNVGLCGAICQVTFSVMKSTGDTNTLLK